jgi:hypothetical protein
MKDIEHLYTIVKKKETAIIRPSYKLRGTQAARFIQNLNAISYAAQKKTGCAKVVIEYPQITA